MNTAGTSTQLRSTAMMFGRVAALIDGLAKPPSGVAWVGPAAGRYRRVAHAVGDRTVAVAGDLAAVPGLLVTLAEAVDAAGGLVSRWDAAIEAAQHRRARAEATGDPVSIASSEEELGEVRRTAERAVEGALDAVTALDRRTASVLDALLITGEPIELGSPAGSDAAAVPGNALEGQLEHMATVARLEMAEHANGPLTEDIERLELAVAYLRTLGLTGIDVGLLEELRRHRARLLEWAASERQFLAYTASDGGRVVEVFGDLAHADHVAVLVPGITNSEFNYHASLDGVARSLQNGDPSVAVIAWLGYDTPGSGPTGTGMLTLDAIDRDLASAGAEELVAFIDWLSARRDDAHTTVIAHSYGSVVAAMAAADDGLAIDDLVLVGSPGVPVDDRSDLHLRPGGVVWAGLAPWDPIDELAGVAAPGEALIHGTNPVGGDFGSVELPFEDSFGHSGYFDRSGIPMLISVITGRRGSGRRRDNERSGGGGGAW